MKQLTTYFEIAFKTSATSRFSQTHLIKDESVLEHTGFVCMMSYFIATQLISEGHKGIDLGTLMCKATAHDLDEIVTGDIPRPTKYYNEGIKEALSVIEKSNMRIIDEELKMNGRVYDDWSSSKEGKEGSIVELADALAIVYKAWQECMLFGNKTIIDHATNKPAHFREIDNSLNNHFPESEYLHSILSEAKMMCKQIEDER